MRCLAVKLERLRTFPSYSFGPVRLFDCIADTSPDVGGTCLYLTRFVRHLHLPEELSLRNCLCNVLLDIAIAGAGGNGL